MTNRFCKREPTGVREFHLFQSNAWTENLKLSDAGSRGMLLVLSSAVEAATAGLAAIGELFAISSFMRSAGVLDTRSGGAAGRSG
jgi:hypothetical protein